MCGVSKRSIELNIRTATRLQSLGRGGLNTIVRLDHLLLAILYVQNIAAPKKGYT